MNKTQLIKQLYEIDAIKLGSFTLKSGLISPIYIDLRPIVSYPMILKAVADLIFAQINPTEFDLLCGVPYTALPIATCISLQHNKPMVMVRKEAKAYGTKKQVEGHFQMGQTCLLIEDVVTTGSSVLTTLNELNQVGIKVSVVAAFLDREQGGKEAIAKAGCHLHTVLTLTELLTELNNNGILKTFQL